MAEEEDSMKGTVNKIHSCLWTLDTMMMMMHHCLIQYLIARLSNRQVRVSAATTEVGEDGFDDFGRRIGTNLPYGARFSCRNCHEFSSPIVYTCF